VQSGRCPLIATNHATVKFDRYSRGCRSNARTDPRLSGRRNFASLHYLNFQDVFQGSVMAGRIDPRSSAVTPLSSACTSIAARPLRIRVAKVKSRPSHARWSLLNRVGGESRAECFQYHLTLAAGARPPLRNEYQQPQHHRFPPRSSGSSTTLPIKANHRGQPRSMSYLSAVSWRFVILIVGRSLRARDGRVRHRVTLTHPFQIFDSPRMDRGTINLCCAADVPPESVHQNLSRSDHRKAHVCSPGWRRLYNERQMIGVCKPLSSFARGK